MKNNLTATDIRQISQLPRENSGIGNMMMQNGGSADNPQTSQQSSTMLLERTEEEKAPGDNERFAHYVRQDKIMKSMVEGGPVVALCGKVWIPVRNPDKYPLCPTCKEIYKNMRNLGNGGTWPFGPNKP